MFEEVLLEQNPHWDEELYEDGIIRSAFEKLLEFMSTHMIIAIMGVRRAGKSTLMKQLINHLIIHEKVPPKNILFLNLEHPFFTKYADDVANLERIFDCYLKTAEPQKGKIYCLLDEVQFFHKWQIFVKAHFETKKIKFIITGSNSALLSSDLMTLLSGRALPLQIYPLSFQEIALFHQLKFDAINLVKNRHKLQKLLKEYMRFGGFPEVATSIRKEANFDTLNAYSKSILYQDVAPRLETRHPTELEKLFVYLISNIGKPFSYHKLSELFSLSDKSIKEYIKACADSYLLFELDLFSYSLKRQIRHPKKIYSIDTGQVNATSFAFSENSGRLFENLVFLELKKCGFDLFYYKTENDYDVDFVVKERERHALIQVAWNMHEEEVKKRELRALTDASKELKLKNSLIITKDLDDIISIDGNKVVIQSAYKFFCKDLQAKRNLLFG